MINITSAVSQVGKVHSQQNRAIYHAGFQIPQDLLHGQSHFSADVLQLVVWSDWEIAFLVTDLVSKVGHFIPTGIPDAFVAINGVEGAVALAVVLDVVEDEELGFGTEDGLIGQSGGNKESFSTACDATRIAIVEFLCSSFCDGAGDGEGWDFAEGINEGGVGIRHAEKSLNSELERVEFGYGINPKNHFFNLRSLIPDLCGIAILDNDGRDHKDSNEGGLTITYWKRYEAENYFITPEILSNYAKSAYRELELFQGHVY